MDHSLPLSDKSAKQEMARAGLCAFLNISKDWKLTTDEQICLLGVPRSTFFKWREDMSGRLSHDTLERLSYILGIYKALQILIPDTALADSWIKRPNDDPLFSGQSALTRMLSGNVSDLYVVRQYLDAQRGGWN